MELQEGVGFAAPFTDVLENSKDFQCLSSICNSWCDTNMVLQHSCHNTVIYTSALHASQKKEVDIPHGHMEPKETERKIHKNNSNDNQKV